MPRRSPDQGVKPFEFRVGVGGLPSLGGMVRSGDPATIPPNKHHLVTNVRIGPIGMISRPGLSESFNSGNNQCIDGMTSMQQRLRYGRILVWPGGVGQTTPTNFASPAQKLNSATFKAFEERPGSVWTGPYQHEHVFVMSGPVGGWNTQSPVVDFQNGVPPFNFAGKVCTFMKLSRTLPSGTVEQHWALVSLELPHLYGYWDNIAEATAEAAGVWIKHSIPERCPRMYGDATHSSPVPCASQLTGSEGLSAPGVPGEFFFPDFMVDAGVWPRTLPVGSIKIISWVPSFFAGVSAKDISIPTKNTYYTGHLELFPEPAVIPESVFDPIAGTRGVRPVLYTLTISAAKTTLLRFDGFKWSSELVLPDSLEYAAVSKRTATSIWVLGNKNPSADDPYFVYRDEAGAWQTIDTTKIKAGATIYRWTGVWTPEWDITRARWFVPLMFQGRIYMAGHVAFNASGGGATVYGHIDYFSDAGGPPFVLGEMHDLTNCLLGGNGVDLPEMTNVSAATDGVSTIWRTRTDTAAGFFNPSFATLALAYSGPGVPTGISSTARWPQWVMRAGNSGGLYLVRALWDSGVAPVGFGQTTIYRSDGAGNAVQTYEDHHSFSQVGTGGSVDFPRGLIVAGGDDPAGEGFGPV